MSHYMTALAMRQTGLKPAAKIVLYWLADHHNSETGRCFPSLNKLAEECQMTRPTVIKHLGVLEAAGLIRRDRQTRENGSQTSTSYTLNLSEPPVKNVASPCKESCQPPVKEFNGGLLKNDTPLTLEDSTLEGLTSEPTAEDMLCLVVDAETARNFVEHRKAMKKPLTKMAAKIMVGKLKDHPDPVAVFNASIMGGYQGIFPDNIGGRNDRTNHNQSPARSGDRPDPAIENIARIIGLDAAQGRGGF